MAEYIERKALCKTVEDYASTHPVMHDNELFALFCSIPAADVRSVVRGKWIDTDNYYQRWKCSVCGCHTRDAAPNYCPSCGAEMERGESDG